MDKSIKIWDTKTGQCTMTLKGHTKGIWCLNFYTSTLLISGSYDMTIRVCKNLFYFLRIVFSF